MRGDDPGHCLYSCTGLLDLTSSPLTDGMNGSKYLEGCVPANAMRVGGNEGGRLGAMFSK